VKLKKVQLQKEEEEAARRKLELEATREDFRQHMGTMKIHDATVS